MSKKRFDTVAHLLQVAHVQWGETSLQNVCVAKTLETEAQPAHVAPLNTCPRPCARVGTGRFRIVSSRCNNRAGDFPPLNPDTGSGHGRLETWRASLVVWRRALAQAVAPDQNSVTNSPHRTSQENVRTLTGTLPRTKQGACERAFRVSVVIIPRLCKLVVKMRAERADSESCGFPLTFHFREWTARCLHKARLAVNRLFLPQVNALTSFRGAFLFSAFSFPFRCSSPCSFPSPSSSLLSGLTFTRNGTSE
jgi:hypothetical protein